MIMGDPLGSPFFCCNIEPMNEQINTVTEENNAFTQPDTSTCVPTSLAYLLYKEKGLDFKKTVKTIVNKSYEIVTDLKENGMEFDQLGDVARSLGIATNLTEIKPGSHGYLTQVTKLPKHEYSETELTRHAKKEDSLREGQSHFEYPYGHAIVVFEKENGQATIYDSFFGTETSISMSELDQYLEQPPTYLSL